MPIMDLSEAIQVSWNQKDVLEIHYGSQKVWSKLIPHVVEPDQEPELPKPTDGSGRYSITGKFLGYGWYGDYNPIGIRDDAVKGKINDIHSIKTVIMKGITYKVKEATQYYGTFDLEVEPPVVGRYEYDEEITITFDD